MQILQDRIIWDEQDWVAGLAPQNANNIGLTFGGHGASFQRNVNPYRRLGGIAPGYSPTTVSGVDASSVTAMITAGDASYAGSTPFAYLAGGAQFHKLTLSGTPALSTSDFPKTIPVGGGASHGGHTDLSIKDVVVHNIGASTVAFYSYSDNSDGDVGIYDIGASFTEAFTTNFMSDYVTSGTVLGSTGSSGSFLSASNENPHPLIVGDDGALYIGDGRTLRKYDGESETSYGTLSTSFNLPRGFIIRAFGKILNYLVLFTSRSFGSSGSFYRGTTIVWFWNYLSDKPNYSYIIPDNIVTAAFNWNGILGCFTYGRSAEGNRISTKLNILNGSRFEPIVFVNNNPPGLNSVEIHDQMVLWHFSNGSQGWIGSYGSPWQGRIPNALNFWGEPTGTSQSFGLGGLCKNFGGVTLYVSSGIGTSGGLESFLSDYGPSTADASSWQGLTAVPLLPQGMKAKIKAVRVMFRNSASGGRTVTLSLVSDFRANKTMTVISGESAITTETLTREFRFDTNNNQPPYFTSIAPTISWSTGSGETDAPTIHRIEVFYEPSKFIPNW